MSQSSNVNLQNIFWVIGIIVGLLTILQFVMSFLQERTPQPNNSDVKQTKQLEKNFQQKKQSKDVKAPDFSATKMGNYTVYANGTVIDDVTNMMWMRCSLGQEWNGTTCIGEAKQYTSEEAFQAIEQLNRTGYAGFYQWELPQVEDLYTLIYCSNGYEERYNIISKQKIEKEVDHQCVGNYQKPTINGNAFPNTASSIWHGYWSATPNKNGDLFSIYFNSGEIKLKDKAHYVRAIRPVK